MVIKSIELDDTKIELIGSVTGFSVSVNGMPVTIPEAVGCTPEDLYNAADLVFDDLIDFYVRGAA